MRPSPLSGSTLDIRHDVFMDNAEGACLRIATINVQNLAPTLAKLLELMKQAEVDICLLQETRCNAATRVRVKRQCCDAGYKYVKFGNVDADDTEWLCTIGRIPFKCFAPKDFKCHTPERVQHLAISRPGRAHLEVTNLYAHASNEKARTF